MCQCTPSIRTPYCGKGNCQWPDKKPTTTIGMQISINPEHQTNREFAQNFLSQLETQNPELYFLFLESDADVGVVIRNARNYADKLLPGALLDENKDDIQLQKKWQGVYIEEIRKQLVKAIPARRFVLKSQLNMAWGTAYAGLTEEDNPSDFNEFVSIQEYNRLEHKRDYWQEQHDFAVQSLQKEVEHYRTLWSEKTASVQIATLEAKQHVTVALDHDVYRELQHFADRWKFAREWIKDKYPALYYQLLDAANKDQDKNQKRANEKA